MPGLFGFVRVDEDRRLDPEFFDAVFSDMSRRLHHHPSHQIHRWTDLQAGLLVGRIGDPHVNLVPWPRQLDKRGENALFAGVLHATTVDPDVETFTQNYLSSGIGALRALRGFYALVQQSNTLKKTVIAADRRASVPIYYTECGGLLFFAPELKAFLAVRELNRQIDPEAMAMFLASGHLLGEQTLFKSVKRLSAGQALEVGAGRVQRTVYWRFSPGSNVSSASDVDLQEELGRLVGLAVERNLGDPSRTVIFLSGGTDSRAVLGGAVTAVGDRGDLLHTVNWGSDQYVANSDVAVATEIASALRLQHRFVKRSTEDYAQDFAFTNFLIDGQSDIAAEHPHEYRIMRILSEDGFFRVLRGDEVFGWRIRVYSMSGALAEVGLRRLKGLQRIAEYTHPNVYRELCDASDEAINSALKPVLDLEPNDAKDHLYFAHRLQGYLNTAAYFKQLLLDHRNVLLDESLLDFLAMVPTRLRIDKLLYRRAMARKYPALWKFDVARRNNLEDWSRLLVEETQVRRFALQQLDDEKSGIWDYFDPRALRRVLDSLAPGNTERQTIGVGWRNRRATLKKALFSVAPPIAALIRAQNVSRRLEPNKALMRVLVLKHWHDTFVTGDGNWQPVTVDST